MKLIKEKLFLNAYLTAVWRLVHIFYEAKDGKMGLETTKCR